MSEPSKYVKKIQDKAAERQVTSLFEFINKSQANGDIYDTTDICLSAKHTMQSYMIAYEGIIQLIQENPQDKKSHAMLLSMGDRIREVSLEIINVLKKGAEIDVLVSSRYDALQLLVLLEQIPAQLVEVVESSIKIIVDDIRDHITNVVNRSITLSSLSETDRQNLVAELCEHEFLRSANIFAISNAVKNISDELSRRIKDLKTVIPSKEEEKQTLEAVELDVRAMLASVPVQPSVGMAKEVIKDARNRVKNMDAMESPQQLIEDGFIPPGDGNV